MAVDKMAKGIAAAVIMSLSSALGQIFLAGWMLPLAFVWPAAYRLWADYWVAAWVFMTTDGKAEVAVTPAVLEAILRGDRIDVCHVIPVNCLCIGHVLDVFDFVSSKDLLEKRVYEIVMHLLDERCGNVDEANFMKKVRKYVKERKDYGKKSKEKQTKTQKQRVSQFVLPGRQIVENMEHTIQGVDNVEPVSASGENDGCKECVKVHRELDLTKAEISACKEKNESLQGMNDALEKKVLDLKAQVASLDQHNVSRKIKRREKKVEDLERQIEMQKAHCKNEVEELKKQMKKDMGKELDKLRESLKEDADFEHEKSLADFDKVSDELNCLKAKVEKMRKQLWYRDNKPKRDDSENVKKVTSELKERVRELENENCELNERLEAFMESEEIKCFQGGRYTDQVRNVYQMVVGMGVSARKSEAIVRSVLSGFGMKVDRLPKETFAKRMVLECRALACMQLCEILDEGQDVSVNSDGTCKWGHHYQTFDVSMKDGSTYVMGLRNISSGSAECMLKVLQDILGDMYVLYDQESASLRVKKVIARVKNTMSDRAVTEKKFNLLLSEFRREILPDVVDGWNEMSEDEQEKFAKMNHFFCGLHVLVNLAEQSDTTLRVWENLIFKDSAVGANAACGLRVGSSESGTVRLVRTACKSVQQRACQQSGKPVWFCEYVHHSFGHDHIPLAPFKGNRFNILFHNGAGVYFLKSELLAFMNEVKEDNNLMRAVNADLNVDQYLAGTRALGIIDKVITTPLWKVLERKEHVSGMTERFETLIECLEKWSKDASMLLDGKECVYDDVEIEKDDVYNRLTTNCELDEMTKQVLGMLCAAYVKRLRYMFKEEVRVEGEEQMRETESVPRTNVACERDFGMLDQMMRERPSAHTCALEGLIMYKKNDTKGWLESLEEEKLREVCEKARKSVDEQRKLFIRRKAVIGAEMAAKMTAKKCDVERKAQKEQIRAEDMTADLAGYGGFWKNETDMDDWLHEKDEKLQQKGVESQLKFRKFVLKCKNVNGILNVSANGKIKDLKVLKENLRECLGESAQERVNDEDIVAVFKGKCADEASVKEIKDASRMDEPPTKRLKKDRKVPFVKDIDDLLGKRIEYLAERGVWKKGVVVGIGERCGKGYMCSVEFDGEEDVHKMDVIEHFRSGALKIVAISVNDLLGRMVEQRFEDDDAEKVGWWKAEVTDVRNARLENPEFVVEYEKKDDDEEEGEWRFRLFEDYMNGDLRLCGRVNVARAVE